MLYMTKNSDALTSLAMDLIDVVESFSFISRISTRKSRVIFFWTTIRMKFPKHHTFVIIIGFILILCTISRLVHKHCDIFLWEFSMLILSNTACNFQISEEGNSFRVLIFSHTEPNRF